MMQLSKIQKVILGIVTLGFVISALVPLPGEYLAVESMFLQGSVVNPNNDSVKTMMTIRNFLQFMVVAFYLAHIIKNRNGKDVLRIILGIGAFYISYLALPIYYFIFIWPNSIPEWAIEKEG